MVDKGKRLLGRYVRLLVTISIAQNSGFERYLGRMMIRKAVQSAVSNK
jgi:hypothetical protein